MEIPRDSQGVAHIVALSGGKDSTALALALKEREPREYFYVCTPTGNELPEMFDHWKCVGELLGRRIYPLMPEGFRQCMTRHRALPNSRMRFCTRDLKIKPYYRWVLSITPAVSYVGLRADEDRDGITHGGGLSILPAYDLPLWSNGLTVRYPLQEWGWGVGDVLDYLNKRGVCIPERTDCALCFFQRLGEWYNLLKQHPDMYEEGVQYEKQFGHTFRSKDRDAWPASLEELRAEFERGRLPEVSLRMMEKRKGMCRTCSL